jgi:hypothetical protein
MRATQPPVNESRAGSRYLEVPGERPHGEDGDDLIVAGGPTSRFLEKASNSRVLDSVSPRTGMLPRRCRTKGKGPAIAIGRLAVFYADDATEVQVHIGSVLLVIWLVIGGIAAGQRGDYNGPVGCSRAGTIAATIIAGPLNYAGVNPNINCTVQHPSN